MLFKILKKQFSNEFKYRLNPNDAISYYNLGNLYKY